MKKFLSWCLLLCLIASCVGGPVTPEDFSTILGSLREAFQVYQEITLALEDAENEEEEKIEEIRLSLEEALEDFVYWRERLSDLGILGKREAKKYQVEGS